jgi:hypothetical protein
MVAIATGYEKPVRLRLDIRGYGPLVTQPTRGLG